MADIPVWAIIFGIMGLLVNLVLALTAWSISRLLGSIKESILALTTADQELAAKFLIVSKELSEHKLHVSEKYVKQDHFNSTTAAIFSALREAKDEIVERVQELVRHLEARINHYNDPHSQ